MLNKVFCLIGPTASGKTALACELVQKFPFEIISVDSAMVYREMDIGTAKPTPAELALAPHHLIDIINPDQSFSAAQFCETTDALCQAILQRNKIPLLVGGTTMYFHAMQQGLALLPEANETVRDQLLQQAMHLGWDQMHEQLRHIDPSSAAKIHPNDKQRIQRALEIYEITGKPLSILLQEQQGQSRFTYVNLILFPEDRSWLHQRIAQRFEMMLQQGFIHEVEQLLSHWCLEPNCLSMRCVGYRQAYEYLQKKISYEDFCARGIAATRQLAKRQLTWLRHWPDAYVFSCDLAESKREIIALISKILDNHKKQ